MSSIDYDNMQPSTTIAVVGVNPIAVIGVNPIDEFDAGKKNKRAKDDAHREVDSDGDLRNPIGRGDRCRRSRWRSMTGERSAMDRCVILWHQPGLAGKVLMFSRIRETSQDDLYA